MGRPTREGSEASRHPNRDRAKRGAFRPSEVLGLQVAGRLQNQKRFGRVGEGGSGPVPKVQRLWPTLARFGSSFRGEVGGQVDLDTLHGPNV